MQQVVVLTGVEEKAKGKNARGPWQLRLFTAAGGTKFQTFDVDLGEKAVTLIGQSAELEYELEENGNFQNNVIKSIKAANGKVEPGQTADDYQGNSPGVVNAVKNSLVETDRQLRIMRQSALDRAINTVAAGIGGLEIEKVDAYQLFTLADSYIHYFENGNN